MIEKIESYTQKNGNEILKVYCKPTSKFPKGFYFYTDLQAKDLISSYTWSLFVSNRNTNISVIRHKSDYTRGVEYFYRDYAFNVLGYYPNFIDHVNGLEFDNTDENLNVVSKTQNSRNKQSLGYIFRHRLFASDYYAFEINVEILDNILCQETRHTEIDAFESINRLQKKYYSDYNYNFLKDRRGELDLLDLERTGVVSAEEATYRHVRRFVDTNPWYAYRYNLQEYCKDNHIIIPDFRLDEQGFMIHPVTGKRFSPYEKEVQ